MAAQHTVKVGNTTIVLSGTNDPFSDGHTTGYLEFYDERHRLTSQIIHDHLLTIISEPSMPSLWRAGRIAGWMEALIENSPQTFRSFVAGERMTALQEV